MSTHRTIRSRKLYTAAVESLESRLLLAANAWKSAVSGDWGDATKWSAGHVPTATEDVSIAVAGNYTVTHNGSGTNDVNSLTISAASATLKLNAGAIEVTGATNVSGGTFNLAGGKLVKGTLSTSGTGKFVLTNSGGLDGVTLNTNVSVPTGAALGLYHTITINSGKKITATDSSVYLNDQADAGASLAGSGEIVLGGTSGGSLALNDGLGHEPSIGSSVKVHGFGTIGMAGTNNGTIQADQNGKTLTIGNGTWVNKGTLSAINGAILTVGGTWSSPSPGKLNETNSTLNLAGEFTNIPLPTRTGGTIAITGHYDLAGATLALTATTGSWNIDDGNLRNGTLTATGGAQLVPVHGPGFENMTISTDVTVSNASLFLAHSNTLSAGKKIISIDGRLYLEDKPEGGAALTGSGEVVLGGSGQSVMTWRNGNGHNPTIGSSIKIHGFGEIYSYGGTNNGTIQADQAGKTLLVSGITWVNKGTLSAINGSILTLGGKWSSPSPGKIEENASTLNLGGEFNTIPMPTRTAGTIFLTGVFDAKNGAVALNAMTGDWDLKLGTIANATITTAGGAQLLIHNGNFDHVTIGSDLAVTNSSLGLTHANTLSAGKKLTVSDSFLSLYDSASGGASLGGSGEIILGGLSAGASTLSLYNGAGHNPTLGASLLVHGFGSVDFLAGTNNATIRADQNGKSLNVYGGTWVNKGTLSAVNGALMQIGGTWSSPSPGSLNESFATLALSGTFNNIPKPTRLGGIINIGGSYDLKGGKLTLDDVSGNWNLLSTGRIANGTLEFDGDSTLNVTGIGGTLDKITLANDLSISNATLYLRHACTLANGVKLTATNSSIYLFDQVDGGASLAGNGEVILGGANGGKFFYNASSGHVPTTAAGIRIHGRGTVTMDGGINNGTIEADQTGFTLFVSGANATNKGLVKASHGATLEISDGPAFTNQGVLVAEGAKIQINGAFNVGASGIIDIGIGGTGQGTTYGFINCTGAMTLAGTINTYLINGLKPANNASFTPIQYASKTGSFATSNFNAGGGVAFVPTFGATSLSIKANTLATSVASVSAGKLTLNGTSAADTLVVTDSRGVVTASRGGVTSVFSSASISGININGGDDNDKITYTGSTIPSTLSGGNGNDSITGSNADDAISGDAGNDTMLGNNGNDWYTFANASTAEIDQIVEANGGGTDLLNFAALTTAVTVNLGNDTLATMTNRTVKTKNAGQFVNLENVIGGSNNDIITGNAAANVILGGNGVDTFFMQDGTTKKDTVDAGGGADIIGSQDAIDVFMNV